MTANDIVRAEGFEWRNTRLGHFIERYGYGCIDSLLREAVHNPEPFWEALVAHIGLTWLSPYRSVLGTAQHAPKTGWFHGGKLNIAVDAVVKWANSDPERIAITWEGFDGASRALTTQELKSEVCRVARGLVELGIGKGDSVAISLPVLPEAVVVMLAIAQIGGVIVPVAGAAEPKLTAAQLNHCGARVAFCADRYFRDGREIAHTREWREIQLATPTMEAIIVIPRLASERKSPAQTLNIASSSVSELNYGSLGMSVVQACAAIGQSASDPVMLSYSGSNLETLACLVQTHSGFSIKACQDMDMSFDVRPGDCLMWLAKLDWVSGLGLVFGVLALGASIVLMEDPSDRLDISRTWSAVKRHGVTHLGLSANVAQRLMKAGVGAGNNRDLSRLRILAATGEDWDATTWRWLFEVVGKRKRPIVRHKIASGTSGSILGSFAGLPMRCDGFSGPLPGVSAAVWDRAGRPVQGEIGDLVILKPWPWMTRHQLETTYERPEDGRRTRCEYWLHGTRARIDADGFWFDHGISDRHDWL